MIVSEPSIVPPLSAMDAGVMVLPVLKFTAPPVTLSGPETAAFDELRLTVAPVKLLPLTL